MPGVRRPGLLVLADGTTFEGEAVGWEPPGGVATGEVVFNTVLAGYQEVITDPSYAGQIITFTCPHIGNYGVTPDDDESRRPHCRGIIVRDLARRPSSWRSALDLESFLIQHRVPGLTGLDTRRLTRHIREAGSMAGAFGTASEVSLKEAALAEPGTEGVDLVATVTTGQPYTIGDGPLRIVAYDFGIKRTILRHLGRMATVEVVPAATPASEALDRQPDGVFLSNGPGDPAAVVGAADAIAGLLGRVPVFGICLGHQLLATALGAETFKMKFGHHGGNHPVRRLETGAVEITSQNHNFAVAVDSLSRADVTHINLNDGVIEGLRCHDAPAFSVQYHPEAGPGPHDARYLFAQFARLMTGSTGSTGARL
ncbi:MAG: glutamine-hydrolyzing carbamoyl-phosphate synthase small subunit [Actinomycetota bacterium]|nr:glutamine-hydrolyzing carbamoyl-phosphate synthase small subunit [Actinomycetota bacterium]MDQ6948060.1 glutamine-hydrolyzing carbamoyl-phosphate synthase small subunit [Actinomycetota bacterium]